MKLRWKAFSNIGPRETNQDCILLPNTDNGERIVCAIADGIGGAPGGAEAASLAIELARSLEDSPSTWATMFEQIVVGLRKRAEAAPEFSRMGTTLSVALLTEDTVQVGHVGDTRIYHLRGDGLNSLTQDQTEIAELVRKQVISPRQAKRYPRRNVLLSALTPTADFKIHESSAEVRAGDRLLLLSDGVHQKVTRGAIIQASNTSANVEQFVDEIERRTIAGGPSDNYSAIGIEILEA